MTLYKGAFTNKTVVVTGAGSGVGRATATAYAKLRANLALLDIDNDGLAQTAKELSLGGNEALCLTLDIADPGNCQRAINAVVERFGGVDVLCNVAGIVGFRPIDNIDVNYWRKTFAVNLDGPFFLSQSALPHLKRSGGNIINVASSAALVAEAYLVPYATSKAALVHMTKSMAMETINDSVRINAIAPGAIDTPIMEGQSFPEGINFDLVARYTGLRDTSDPAEIADFIVYVSSPLAKSIHGACLSIDGGISAG